MTFSIIIPVYNVAPYLRECLDSVLAATRTLEVGSKNEELGVGVGSKNYELGMKEGSSAIPNSSFSLRHSVEIICVDDGSTDGSGEIADAWASEVRSKNEEGRSVVAEAAAEVGVTSWSGRKVASAASSMLRAGHEKRVPASDLPDLGTQVGDADTRNFAKSDVATTPAALATPRSAFREVASLTYGADSARRSRGVAAERGVVATQVGTKTCVSPTGDLRSNLWRWGAARGLDVVKYAA